jgi:hypothetical protein
MFRVEANDQLPVIEPRDRLPFHDTALLQAFRRVLSDEVFLLGDSQPNRIKELPHPRRPFVAQQAGGPSQHRLARVDFSRVDFNSSAVPPNGCRLGLPCAAKIDRRFGGDGKRHAGLFRFAFALAAAAFVFAAAFGVQLLADLLADGGEVGDARVAPDEALLAGQLEELFGAIGSLQRGQQMLPRDGREPQDPAEIFEGVEASWVDPGRLSLRLTGAQFACTVPVVHGRCPCLGVFCRRATTAAGSHKLPAVFLLRGAGCVRICVRTLWPVRRRSWHVWHPPKVDTPPVCQTAWHTGGVRLFGMLIRRPSRRRRGRRRLACRRACVSRNDVAGRT